MSRNTLVARMLGTRLVHVSAWRKPPAEVTTLVGWGRKAPALKTLALAEKHDLPFITLEDGFLRSFGLGVNGTPALSVVVDDLGIYFDARQPSRLEQILQHETFSAPRLVQADQALERLRRGRLTKYNQGTEVPPGAFDPDRKRVLLVDQTAGDASITCGLATEETFLRMLEAAFDEHPDAQVWIKTHPDVLAGRRQSCLSHARDRRDVHWITQDWHPHDLLDHFHQVYVVTSQMGLDALIVGRPVTCFGVPFYSGWGLTDDRTPCDRRTTRRTLRELIAAAYLRYPRYLDPETGNPGDFFQVADFIERQQRVRNQWPRRFIGVGVQRWKQVHLRPLLAQAREGVVFVPTPKAAAAMDPRPGDALVHWGRDAPEDLMTLAGEWGLRTFFIEDGFYRSVGLGSDLIPPRSLVLDEQGLYFDPRTPSDLERLLNTAVFQPDELVRARTVRDLIVRQGLTKYNLESHAPVQWPAQGRPVILVPGQVEDDASIRHGCAGVNTNLGLIRAARAACPGAFIVFKPHPDVSSGNRRGHVPDDQALAHADWIEREASVVACIEAADAVHTMTSMAGFEALLREKPVVVHGRPFYAGWGLTQDALPMPGRTRRLTLDALVAGALLRYPLYWDGSVRGFVACEAVLQGLVAERDALQAQGRLVHLRRGWVRRQVRKVRGLVAGLLPDRQSR
ncbi:capsular polysaccharide biosynthesis protein [Ectothiorhodospira lacustris]|uniref:capsular polysaccharide biosynthesis protein n=2 Tax=Ectothiorhodospira lacustris TaxID=2899127 RepID=UPI001EE92448|nr:capsular polysaccharide biosynthesis protein [Ectothiorhodospira lacustris]MCG5522868.1 capsular polysaccharide biosynthesis protein [Ectothiorhodospira lacustris]